MADKLLRTKDVLQMIGIGKTLLYQYIQDGSFPKGIKLGCRAVVWPESLVIQWVEDRKAGKPLQPQEGTKEDVITKNR